MTRRTRKGCLTKRKGTRKGKYKLKSRKHFRQKYTKRRFLKRGISKRGGVRPGLSARKKSDAAQLATAAAELKEQTAYELRRLKVAKKRLEDIGRKARSPIEDAELASIRDEIRRLKGQRRSQSSSILNGMGSVLGHLAPTGHNAGLKAALLAQCLADGIGCCT